MSMFSSFSFKSIDDSPKPRIPLHNPQQDQYSEEDDREYDSFHSSSGFGSGRQSRSSLTALAEDDEVEEDIAQTSVGSSSSGLSSYGSGLPAQLLSAVYEGVFRA
ncbi:uncharacterized protein I206_101755 [Kwoniella pini CBS 10737]|uniref:Uncharacterized protein n=1 Tax=Kwoniella pini CBS 10737 TaxID=1296096 RepID=A0A1B9HVU5_9TREE|nr:uncharacterized protein I206_06274 [Kwoniella pini CBS 10737]OCF47378.1 hypothetical protein I206_06274 [Kwoniella pini CBS 10737]